MGYLAERRVSFCAPTLSLANPSYFHSPGSSSLVGLLFEVCLVALACQFAELTFDAEWPYSSCERLLTVRESLCLDQRSRLRVDRPASVCCFVIVVSSLTDASTVGLGLVPPTRMAMVSVPTMHVLDRR